jgi:hypothetical protein
VMHFQRVDNTHTLVELMTGIDSSFAGRGNLAAPVASAWTLHHLSALALYDASLGVEHDLVNTIVGQTGTDWVPQVAGVVKFTTDVRGRSNRGRLFLPGIAEGAMDSSGISDSKVTACTEEWDGFLNQMAVTFGSWAGCIASYKNRNAHQITNAALEKVTGTQRRRNRKR